jgi:hypothetical protein
MAARLPCQEPHPAQPVDPAGGQIMWALFCEDSQVSRSYPTREDVWRHATENDLVDDGHLQENYQIRKVEEIPADAA